MKIRHKLSIWGSAIGAGLVSCMKSLFDFDFSRFLVSEGPKEWVIGTMVSVSFSYLFLPKLASLVNTRTD